MVRVWLGDHWWGRLKLSGLRKWGWLLWCGANQFYLPSRVLVRYPCIWRRTYVLHESLLRNACVHDQAPRCFFSVHEEVVCSTCSKARLLSVRILSLWAWRFELNQCCGLAVGVRALRLWCEMNSSYHQPPGSVNIRRFNRR